MVNREKLLAIEDLKLVEKLMYMNQSQVDDYAQILDQFVEDFPRYEANLKEILEKKDGDALSKEVLALRGTLVKIGADDIAAECWKYVNNYTAEKLSRFEAYVTFLISQLSALSIDIQMALFKEEEKAEEEPVASPPPAPTPVAVQKTILAVDDDPQCLDVFKLALSEVNCRIIAVTSGPVALGILKKQQPDLCVFDIDMPIMDGIKLAKNAKEAGCNAPIIFITGNSQKETVARAMQAGGNDFILKPINPANVVSRITRFI